MTSYKSDAFQEARQTWEATQDVGEWDKVLAKKGISREEYAAADAEQAAAADAGDTDLTTGFAGSRIAGRAVGDAVSGIIKVGDAFLPEALTDTISSASEAIGEYVPEDMKEGMSQIFDPYHGAGSLDIDDTIEEKSEEGEVTTAAGVEKTIGEVGSWFIPGTAVFKVAKGGLALSKIASPATRKFLIAAERKAGRKARKVIKGSKFGASLGIGMTATTDIDDPDFDTMLLPLSEDATAAEKYLKLGAEEVLINTALLGAGKAVKVAAKTDKGKAVTTAVQKSKLGKLGRLAGEYLGSRRGVSDDMLAAVIKRDNAAKKSMLEADGLSADLRKAAKKDKMATETRLNAALQGDKKAMSELGAETRTIMGEMRGNISKLSGFVRDNVAKGSLKATIGKNMNTYLNTSYDVFDNADFRKSMVKRIKKRSKQDSVVQQAASYLKQQGVPEEDLEQYMLKMIRVDGDGADTLINLSKGAAGTSKVGMQKGKVPSQLKGLYGEITDPSHSYAKTMEKLSQVKAEYDFMDDIAGDLVDRGIMRAGKYVGKGANRKKMGPEGMVELDEALQPRLDRIFGRETGKSANIRNPLEGLYVQPEYAKMIREGLDVPMTKNPVFKAMMHAKSLSQKAKTVWNPATHVVNFLGQATILSANGMFPFAGKSFNKSMNASARKLTNRSNKELGKYLGRAQELGVTDSGVHVATIRKNMQQLGNNADKYMSKNVIRRTAGKIDKAAMDLYQEEDNVFKLMHWEKTKTYLTKAFPNRSVDEIEEMAAARTRDLMPNYSLVNKGLQHLRATPLGNFAAFPAEMIRTSKNLAKYTWKDARSGNPELVKSAAKRLAGMTAVSMMPAVASEYSKQSHGITQEQEDAINVTMPNWQAFSNKFYTSGVDTDKNGHKGIDYMSMSSLDPYDYLKSFTRELHTMANSIDMDEDGLYLKNPPDFNRAAIGVLENQLAPFFGPSIVTEAAIKMAGGREFSEAIATEGQAVDTIGQMLMVVADPFLPGFVNQLKRRHQYNKSLDRGRETGMKDKGYATINEGDIGLAALAGFGNKRHDLTAGLNYLTSPHFSKVGKSSQALRKKMSDPNMPDNKNTWQDIITSYYDGQISKRAGMQNIKAVADSYRKLGFSDDDLIKSFTMGKGAEMNNKKWKAFLNAEDNYFIPDAIGKDIQELATRNEVPFPLKDLQDLQDQFYGIKIMEDD
tara:strand:- start:20638 stop:24225 length:3588 start_codon:yes stop_codon:yes gene_type:complete